MEELIGMVQGTKLEDNTFAQGARVFCHQQVFGVDEPAFSVQLGSDAAIIVSGPRSCHLQHGLFKELFPFKGKRYGL
jgi:hypothetical protein